MEVGRRARHKKRANTLPLAALVFAIIAVTASAVLLNAAVAGLRGENAALKSGMESLRGELKSLRDTQTASGGKSDTLARQIETLTAQAGAIDALKAEMDRLKTADADPGLSVASFELKHFSSAGYAYQSYTGTGTVRAVEKEDSHLVLIQKTLKSGGAPATKKTEYLLVLVVGGTGTFYTDDSAEGAVEKPEYEFAILGSVRIPKGE